METCFGNSLYRHIRLVVIRTASCYGTHFRVFRSSIDDIFVGSKGSSVCHIFRNHIDGTRVLFVAVIPLYKMIAFVCCSSNLDVCLEGEGTSS